MNVAFGADDVDGIPVCWAAPRRAAGAALWLTHLGGSSEQVEPMLARLAEHGLLALSFDPPGLGSRGAWSDPLEFAGWVLSSFRRRMWPLLGQTVLECLRVLDWIDDRFDVPGPRLAGGVSMGGWFFDAFDPMTHLAAYERDIAISFQCGGADQHVPADGAQRFQEALARHDPEATDRLHVELYEGLSHLNAAQDDRLYAAAIRWLAPLGRV